MITLYNTDLPVLSTCFKYVDDMVLIHINVKNVKIAVLRVNVPANKQTNKKRDVGHIEGLKTEPFISN